MSSIITEKDGIVIFHIEGNLGLDAIRTLRDQLEHERKQGKSKIVLDFKEVSNVKSSVLKELTKPIRAIGLVQGKVGMCNMSLSVHRTLQTGMFYKYVKVYDSLDEAFKALKEYK